MAWDSRKQRSGESNWAYNRRRNSVKRKDPSCLFLILFVVMGIAAWFLIGVVQ